MEPPKHLVELAQICIQFASDCKNKYVKMKWHCKNKGAREETTKGIYTL